MDELKAAIDSRFEDTSQLDRRGFMGRVLGTLALGGAWSPGMVSASNLTPVDGGADADNESYWRYIASQFMLRKGVTYMNTGTRGVSPRSVYLAQLESTRAANADRLSYAKHVYNSDRKAAIRKKLAEFTGCDASEIALTNNTTEGMVLGTFGPDFKSGDEIIYTNHDHSSGAQPVNLRSARYGTVPVVVDLSGTEYHPPRSPDQIVDAVARAITPRTRLISICHINYTDGCVMPVKEICALARSRGILTLIDGAHPPGMLELNLHDLGCDMYAGACHKWMMAAQLTGFFYVRQDLLERIWPTLYSGPVKGLTMYGTRAENDRSNTAEKFEIHGSGNYAAGLSIEASLDFLNAITPAAIERRDRYLAEYTRQGLLALDGVELFVGEDPRLCGGLVSFRVKDLKPKTLTDQMWERHQIYLRNVTHPEIGWDANRVSLHLMVTRAQVDRFLAATEEMAKDISRS